MYQFSHDPEINRILSKARAARSAAIRGFWSGLARRVWTLPARVAAS
ncbi:hypothetical protein HKCCE4037_14065 [Rhodobacterales bacterium HKCCE4037]|nr:hypothetical protein [Rhodobacterales bacterium HKCCE4037]